MKFVFRFDDDLFICELLKENNNNNKKMTSKRNKIRWLLQ